MIWFILFASIAPLRSNAQEAVTQTAAKASDGLALSHIFSEQHIDESGPAIVDRSKSLHPEARMIFLGQWVLPNDDHPNFRVSADYYQAGSDEPKIISPAIDWLSLVVQLEHTERAVQQIQDATVSSANDRCDQAALLALLAIEEGNTAEATTRLEDYFTLLLSDKIELDARRDGALLCAKRSTSSPELMDVIHEPVQVMIQHYTSEVARTAWHRHFWAVHAKITREVVRKSGDSIDDVDQLSQWHPISRTSAFEHGSAFPAADWLFRPGSAQNLASRGDDFLFFQSPLLGNFEIENEATAFGYREAQLMVGGVWVTPIYTHKQYGFGNVRGELQRRAIDPPLTDTSSHGWFHYRTKIGNDLATTYFNGRHVHDQSMSTQRDPWIAIRSSYRTDGIVSDLRMTGDVTIPDSINMVDSGELLSWYDYFQPPGNISQRLGSWKGKIWNDGSGNTATEINDARDETLTLGSCAERLLVYTRPIIEDGIIEFDFWYAKGEFAAHPVVGRTCFLLTPTGVVSHQVTDGRFERSNRRPDNLTRNVPGKYELRFKENGWNSLRLQLDGNELTIALNDSPIHQQTLTTPPLDRTFGLFHFADRSNLRIRNPKWTGSWPKEFPDLAKQELATYLNRFLDESSTKLPAVFSHRLDETSIASRKFILAEGHPIQDVQPTADGVLVSRQGRAGYSGAMLSPVIRVGGDFDATVSFDQFSCDSDLGKIGSVRISVAAKNDIQDTALIQRIEDRTNEQSIQCMKMEIIDGSDRRHYFARQPVDADAGRLRISRRDDRVYYLFAENDSQQFRLLGEESFSTEDLQELGIRFGVQIQGENGKSSVRIRKFEVRAEQLGGVATEDQDTLLARLNAERDKLPFVLEHDFTKAKPDEEQTFYRWTDHDPWTADQGGLRVDAPGANTWHSAGVGLRNQFSGDFDATFAFEPITIVTPEEGKHSQVYLQIELDDPDQTQLSCLMTKMPDGKIVSQAQIRVPNGSGFTYRNLGSLGVSDPDHLRLLRRGSDVYYFVGTEEGEFFLGTTQANDRPIDFFGVRMMLHTGNATGTSSMLVRSIQLKADDQVSIMTTVPPILREDATNESLPARLLRSFQSLFD